MVIVIVVTLLGVAIRTWPAGPARRKNAGRARILSLQARTGSARIGPQSARASSRPAWAGPQARIKLKKKKKFVLVYINYFFYGLLH